MPVPICLFALALSAAAADAPNLAANPSFDEADADGGVAGWLADSAGMKTVGFARDPEVKHTGAASARITVAPDEHPAWPAYSFKLPAQPGQCYHLEGWVKTRDAARMAYLTAEYLDAKGNRLSFSSSGTVTGTTDWQLLQVPAQVPDGTATLVVRCILYGTGTAWFDDVRLVRDERAEAMQARLAEPLPEAMLARAITAQGDLSRLQRVMQAAARGGHYTVGIIGGSITQGAKASSPSRHYSAYVVNWFKQQFPAATFDFVNAGIGATGTNYGCLRCQRDLLAKSPDVVVVEYAVNDGPQREFAETYEGLVRQILVSPKQPGVMLLFMMNQAGGNAQEWQAKVGEHYHLPMVSYRDLLWPEIEAKRLTWRDISPDEVHPNDTGHGFCGKLLCALLDRAKASLPAQPLPAPAAELPAALLTDTYQFTQLFEADALKPVGNQGWTYDPAHGWDKAWKADQPGSTLELEASGRQIFLSFWRIRGAMGRAKITIDGEHPSVQDGWFEGTWGGYRQMIKLDAGAAGPHKVRIEVLEEKAPLSTGHEFRLLCLGAAGK